MSFKYNYLIKKNITKKDYLNLFLMYVGIIIITIAIISIINMELKNEIVFNIFMVIPVEKWLLLITFDLLTVGIIYIYFIKKIFSLNATYEELLYYYCILALMSIPFYTILIELTINVDLIMKFLPEIKDETNSLRVDFIMTVFCIFSIIFLWKSFFNSTIKDLINYKMGFIKYIIFMSLLFKISTSILTFTFENNNYFIKEPTEKYHSVFNSYVLTKIQNYRKEQN